MARKQLPTDFRLDIEKERSTQVLWAALHHRVFPEPQATSRSTTTLCQHRRNHKHPKTYLKHVIKVDCARPGRLRLAYPHLTLPPFGLQPRTGFGGEEDSPARRGSRRREVLWVYMAEQRT